MPKGVYEKTKEHRHKLSLAMMGRPLSEETKEKMSLAHKGLTGDKCSQWKGGRYIGQGYVRVMQPSHPHANARGYIREHRLVMEGILGRYLEPEETPHHINGIKDDNRPENLTLFATTGDHTQLEKKGGK